MINAGIRIFGRVENKYNLCRFRILQDVGFSYKIVSLIVSIDEKIFCLIQVNTKVIEFFRASEQFCHIWGKEQLKLAQKICVKF